MEDYQGLCRQLEAVECSIPTVSLVEETEERLVERISLYQARKFAQTVQIRLYLTTIRIWNLLKLSFRSLAFEN